MREKNVKIKRNRVGIKEWMTKDILKMITQRDRLFVKHKNNTVNKDVRKEYEILRNKVNIEIRKRKDELAKKRFSASWQ